VSQVSIQEFVLTYLREIQAEVSEANGVYTVEFPPGRKRRFGRQRRFVFEADKAQQGVELLEPGSPLLKLLLLDARLWGGLGVHYADDMPSGTIVYAFQFNTFSSLKKRTRFVTAVLEPEAKGPKLHEGVPDFPAPDPLIEAGQDQGAAQRMQEALVMVMPSVESAARAFAQDAIRESHEAFRKYLGRVNEYFQGLRQESAGEEARIRKRLGEIQSKLYFTEDGLRQLKLERERDRLTQELYQLKQKRTQGEEKLSSDESDHVQRQRRRHEPKLQIRLLGATLVRPTKEAKRSAAAPLVEPLNPSEPVQELPPDTANVGVAAGVPKGSDTSGLNRSTGVE
jgi:hypothetical protein